MKNTMLILLTALLIPGASYGQKKVTRYCHVLVSSTGGPEADFHNRHKTFIDLDYGNSKTENAFRDSVVGNRLEKVKSMKTSVAVLNYMAQLGWKLVHLDPPYEKFANYEMFFEKDFDESEVNVEADRVYK